MRTVAPLSCVSSASLMVMPVPIAAPLASPWVKVVLVEFGKVPLSTGASFTALTVMLQVASLLVLATLLPSVTFQVMVRPVAVPLAVGSSPLLAKVTERSAVT